MTMPQSPFSTMRACGADCVGGRGARRLFIAIVATVAWMGACSSKEPSSRETAATPIPQPRVEEVETGGRIAHLDVEGLKAWCVDHDLPSPPNVSVCEPGIAESLTTHLSQAAEKRTATSYGLVGEVCYVVQAYDAARGYLSKAAELDPDDSRWPYYLGVIDQDTGNDNQAIEHLGRAVSLAPELGIAHARLGQLYVDRGELDQAWEHAERYARLVPKDSLGYVLMGRVLIERGDAAKAAGYLEPAAQKITNDFQAHYYLGRAYAKLGRTADARKQLDIAGQLPKGNWFRMRDPLDAEAVTTSGSSLALVRKLERILSTDRWQEMASLMEQIIALRAGDFKMMANLADVYRKLGRYQDAHRMLDQAQRVAPAMAELHSKRAALLLAEGKHADAIREADVAIDSGLVDVQPWGVKGRALYLLERYADAEPALRKATELAPTDARTWALLGITLHKLGRLDEAAECYERVLALVKDTENPIYQSARQNLASLRSVSEKAG